MPEKKKYKRMSYFEDFANDDTKQREALGAIGLARENSSNLLGNAAERELAAEEKAVEDRLAALKQQRERQERAVEPETRKVDVFGKDLELAAREEALRERLVALRQEEARQKRLAKLRKLEEEVAEEEERLAARKGERAPDRKEAEVRERLRAHIAEEAEATRPGDDFPARNAFNPDRAAGFGRSAFGATDAEPTRAKFPNATTRGPAHTRFPGPTDATAGGFASTAPGFGAGAETRTAAAAETAEERRCRLSRALGRETANMIASVYAMMRNAYVIGVRVESMPEFQLLRHTMSTIYEEGISNDEVLKVLENHFKFTNDTTVTVGTFATVTPPVVAQPPRQTQVNPAPKIISKVTVQPTLETAHSTRIVGSIPLTGQELDMVLAHRKKLAISGIYTH